MFDLIKRKSGGQPGNRNARKHGFYSQVLSPEEKRELSVAGGVDGLDQEIAILRIKFRSLLAHDGSNHHLINQAAATLGKLYAIKYNLCNTDSDKLKEALNSVLEEFVIPHPPLQDSVNSVLLSPPPEETK
jgi:hypothetical protein